MIRVILVDDEDIEREGMAAVIPWEKLGMQLVDMAWNGIEGLEKIRMHVPDLVITDIKMPVMDGIQLIRSARELYPDMAFVVLSGYGEYDYTSRAMELGIRHYLLKPCDEEKIVQVLNQVKEELELRESRKKAEQEYRHTFSRMLPRVKGELLGLLIDQKELSASDQMLLKTFMDNVKDSFILLGIRSYQELDRLDQFVLTNILSELLGAEHIYMSTAVKNEMVYLVSEKMAENLPPLMMKVHKEFGKYRPLPLRSAVSQTGGMDEISGLYRQLKELFFLSELEGGREFMSYKRAEGRGFADSAVLDEEKIRSAESYGDILFELYCSQVKMELLGFSPERIRDSFASFLDIFCQGKGLKETDGSSLGLLREAAKQCAAFTGKQLPDTKDGERMKQILYGIYGNIKNPDLSLQYLAKEVLFINEDYFGRFFYRFMGEKYSAFLVRIRVQLAKRLMAFKPDIRISELAEQTGFPADGQYFAKVFKKMTGISPSEYRRNFQ